MTEPTAKSLLVGDPFGRVFPDRPAKLLPSVNARTHALRVLRRYISELTFQRPGPVNGSPIPFHVPEKDFHIEPPENFVPVAFPSIGVIPGKGVYQDTGLGSYLIEESYNLYAKGTALQLQSDYNESFMLELWCAKKPERRALVAGLEVSLSPTEQLSGIRFRLPDYFEQTVTFTLEDVILLDDMAGQGRWKAHMTIAMYVDIVQLVNVETLEPYVALDVDPVDLLLVPIAPTFPAAFDGAFSYDYDVTP